MAADLITSPEGGGGGGGGSSSSTTTELITALLTAGANPNATNQVMSIDVPPPANTCTINSNPPYADPTRP